MAYSISTALAIYFVIWWVTLFLTLPFGVRSQHEEGEGAPGSVPGATSPLSAWERTPQGNTANSTIHHRMK